MVQLSFMEFFSKLFVDIGFFFLAFSYFLFSEHELIKKNTKAKEQYVSDQSQA